MLVVAWAPLRLLMAGEYTGVMRSLVTTSAANILWMPSLIIYNSMESLVLLVVEPSLAPEPLEIEASWPTPEEWI
jgi:hypothetical protein